MVRELVRVARKEAARERLEALLVEGLNRREPIEVTPEWREEPRRERRSRLEREDAR